MTFDNETSRNTKEILTSHTNLLQEQLYSCRCLLAIPSCLGHFIVSNNTTKFVAIKEKKTNSIKTNYLISVYLIMNKHHSN